MLSTEQEICSHLNGDEPPQLGFITEMLREMGESKIIGNQKHVELTERMPQSTFEPLLSKIETSTKYSFGGKAKEVPVSKLTSLDIVTQAMLNIDALYNQPDEIIADQTSNIKLLKRANIAIIKYLEEVLQVDYKAHLDYEPSKYLWLLIQGDETIQLDYTLINLEECCNYSNKYKHTYDVTQLINANKYLKLAYKNVIELSQILIIEPLHLPRHTISRYYMYLEDKRKKTEHSEISLRYLEAAKRTIKKAITYYCNNNGADYADYPELLKLADEDKQEALLSLFEWNPIKVIQRDTISQEMLASEIPLEIFEYLIHRIETVKLPETTNEF